MGWLIFVYIQSAPNCESMSVGFGIWEQCVGWYLRMKAMFMGEHSDDEDVVIASSKPLCFVAIEIQVA